MSVANAALVSGGMDTLAQASSLSVGHKMTLTLECVERRFCGLIRPMVKGSNTWNFHRGSHRQFENFAAINMRFSWYRVSFAVVVMSGRKC